MSDLWNDESYFWGTLYSMYKTTYVSSNLIPLDVITYLLLGDFSVRKIYQQINPDKDWYMANICSRVVEHAILTQLNLLCKFCSHCCWRKM